MQDSILGCGISMTAENEKWDMESFRRITLVDGGNSYVDENNKISKNKNLEIQLDLFCHATRRLRR